MSQLDRLQAITTALRSRGSSTMAELGCELGVSVRTIRRDIEALRGQGVDVIGERGRGGGVRLSRQSALPPIRLEEQEVVAMVLAVELAATVPSLPFARAASSALAKVLASLPNARRAQLLALVRRVRVAKPVSEATALTAGEVERDLLDRFEHAFTVRRLLRFEYEDSKGARTVRTVEPHGLLLRMPLWYMLTHDVDRDAPRTFRMDRAHSAKVLPDGFRPRPDLVDSMSRGLGAKPQSTTERR